jgi:putative ABC transport system ATP-binding protein
MNMARSMIEINNVSKVYQMGDTEVRALDGVDISIAEHEFVSIIGPSGSGKSTLMNVIGCLDVPTSGQYFLDGEEVSGFSENKLAQVRSRKIGFVFQQFNLLAKLSALENVELPLVYQGVGIRTRRERAMEALSRVGLSDRCHHKPSELSGGQQQRVAIARALVSDPPLILADEPTGNLDTHSGQEILDILKDLHRRGNTIVIITHDMDVAQATERMIHIRDGKIIGDEGVKSA